MCSRRSCLSQSAIVRRVQLQQWLYLQQRPSILNAESGIVVIILFLSGRTERKAWKGASKRKDSPDLASSLGTDCTAVDRKGTEQQLQAKQRKVPAEPREIPWSTGWLSSKKNPPRLRWEHKEQLCFSGRRKTQLDKRSRSFFFLLFKLSTALSLLRHDCCALFFTRRLRSKCSRENGGLKRKLKQEDS